MDVWDRAGVGEGRWVGEGKKCSKVSLTKEIIKSYENASALMYPCVFIWHSK